MAYYNDDQGREVTVAISAFDVQLLTARQLRGPKHMKKVPAAYLRMLDGDFNFLAVPVAEMRSPRLVRPMHILTDAASGVSAGRLARIERERRDTLLGDAPNMCMAAAMEGLGIPSLSDAFRAPVRSRVPVLMVSGTLDGKTPPANGEAVLKGFSNGGHIVVEGAGHGGRILTGGQVWPLVWDFMQGGQPASVTVPHKSMPDAIPMNAKQLQAYEGSYAMPEGPAVFTAGDGVLHVIYKGRDLELKPQTQRRFFSLDPKVQVTFNLDESGGVNGLITRIQGRTVTAPKQL